MKYTELLTALRYGDLSTSRHVDEDKDFLPESLPLIGIYTNEALTDLHSRFNLLEQDFELTVTEGTKTYTITEEDLLEITEIWEGDKPISFKDRNQGAGVFQPAYNKLTIPKPINTTLRVVYKAVCPLVDPTETDINNITLEVPRAALRALGFYVVHRVYSTIAGDDAVRITNEFQVKYENECLFLRENGLVHQSSYTTNEKLTLNGWK